MLPPPTPRKPSDDTRAASEQRQRCRDWSRRDSVAYNGNTQRAGIVGDQNILHEYGTDKDIVVDPEQKQRCADWYRFAERPIPDCKWISDDDAGAVGKCAN